MRAVGLKLTIEVQAFQPGGCGSGTSCFNGLHPQLQRLETLGMPSQWMMLRLDEPLNKGLEGGAYTLENIATEVQTFVALARAYHPGILITDIEPYPKRSASQLGTWISTLNSYGSHLDYFEVDHDTNEQTWSWLEVKQIQDQTRTLGVKFGYIFGSPVPPGYSWNETARAQSAWCKVMGIVPDHFVFESWETNEDPGAIVPESISSTFTGTIKFIRDGGAFPR